MAMLTRNAILSAQDLPTEVVAVPEWGGEVIVKTLTGRERDRFEGGFAGRAGLDYGERFENIRAGLVALSVVDENGERIFSDEDISALGKKSGAALNRVFEVAQRLSGLKPEDVDELSKN